MGLIVRSFATPGCRHVQVQHRPLSVVGFILLAQYLNTLALSSRNNGYRLGPCFLSLNCSVGTSECRTGFDSEVSKSQIGFCCPCIVEMSRYISGPCDIDTSTWSSHPLWCKHLQEQHLLFLSVKVQVQLSPCGADMSMCSTGLYMSSISKQKTNERFNNRNF